MARRARIERSTYSSPAAVYEVGFKDGGGKQHWRMMSGGSLYVDR
jgi:hypothetical protein